MVVLTTKRPWPNELSLKKHFIKIVQKSVAFLNNWKYYKTSIYMYITLLKPTFNFI